MTTSKKIKGIGFKNFRRFEEFPTLEFGDVTYLVVRNNSGKSTMVKAHILMMNYLQNQLHNTFSFENEVVDYGTIAQGADGNRVFKFKNTGKEPLIITNVKASCGCTTPNYTRNPVAPGEKGEIAVHYDTNRMGQFHKTITVQSNGKSATKVITIKGNVEPKPEAQTTPVKETQSGSKIAK